MRVIMLATAAALVFSVPLAATVQAEDTTVIKKDGDAGRTTIIKKHDEDRGMVRVRPPAEEKKVIIHHDD